MQAAEQEGNGETGVTCERGTAQREAPASELVTAETPKFKESDFQMGILKNHNSTLTDE